MATQRCQLVFSLRSGQSVYMLPPAYRKGASRPLNRNARTWPSALLAGLAALLAATAAAQNATAPATRLRDEWVDPDTGHRVVRLSRIPGESESFYFHQNAFTAEGDKM